MRISSLRISNFKGIRNIQISDLKDLVVIAGPNGCGKSTILDAIRIFKSSYGGYVRDEMSSLMNELQIYSGHQGGLVKHRAVAQDASMDVAFEATIVLSDQEIDHIAQNLESITLERVIIQQSQYNYEQGRHMFRAAKEEELSLWRSSARDEANQIRPLLQQRVASGKVVINREGQVVISPNSLLQFIFSIYSPNTVGIIDFLSADRQLARQQTSNINLNALSSAESLRGSTIYNTAGKYNQITQEMANSYVRRLIREKEGQTVEQDSLWENIRELFHLFFPDKELMEPVLEESGGLAFNIRTTGGFVHDINELSSGEKEILMGYLRLYNASLKNSVILFDEPELHLNPRLVQELPNFYSEHIGKKSNNQIWFITHSDTLLRTAVAEPDYSVFHIVPADQIEDEGNQAYELTAEGSLETAIANLVGISGYVREAKVVFLEGENSEIDKEIVMALYPEFSKLVNIVSAGAKKNVHQVHDLVNEAAKEAGFSGRFYSVVDMDSEGEEHHQLPEGNKFSWNVYHIENYLLEEKFVYEVIVDLHGRVPPEINNPEKVKVALREAAIEVSGQLVTHQVQVHVTKVLSSLTSVRLNPKSQKPGEEIAGLIAEKKAKLEDALNDTLGKTILVEFENNAREQIESSFASDAWRRKIPGREVLKRFVSKHVHVSGKGVSYEVFRNLIRSKMAAANYRPEGMTITLKKIESSIQS